MNKVELIEKISHKTGITKNSARITLDATLHSIFQTLTKGEHIRIIGFGSFSLAKRKARICHHPKTGKQIEVPPKSGIRFKPSSRLINQINNCPPPRLSSDQRNNPSGVIVSKGQTLL